MPFCADVAFIVAASASAASPTAASASDGRVFVLSQLISHLLLLRRISTMNTMERRGIEDLEQD